jgi:hypothetical protein
LDDLYCVAVKRYGALGILEVSSHDHAISQDRAEQLVIEHFRALGPGDKVEITLTRGMQG